MKLDCMSKNQTRPIDLAILAYQCTQLENDYSPANLCKLRTNLLELCSLNQE